MTGREDHGSTTERDAALAEANRAMDTGEDDRPSLADCIPDEPRGCPQEMCQNWTGLGCACAVYDLEPVIFEDDAL